jgi:hypothetical protein
LESVTAKESASMFSGGAYSDIAVEPLTNYFALRAQKDYNAGATTVGGMLTAVNRRLGNDGLDFLHAAAYTGGVDFFHSRLPYLRAVRPLPVAGGQWQLPSG